MDIGNVSLTISIVSLVSTACSPVIANILNNAHQARMFKKEFYEKRKCEVVENYLKSIGNCLLYNSVENKKALSEWTSEIYMYTPQRLWDDIDEMNKKLFVFIDSNYNRADNELIFQYLNFCKKFHRFSRKKV